MFGEFTVYVNEKPIILICNDTVYLKMDDCISTLMSEAEVGIPYRGAKERFILDIDNRTFAQKVVHILEVNTPLPKPKKRKEEYGNSK